MGWGCLLLSTLFPVSAEAQGSLCSFGRAYGPGGSGGTYHMPVRGQWIIYRILRCFLHGALKDVCVFTILSLGASNLWSFIDIFASGHPPLIRLAILWNPKLAIGYSQFGIP